MTATVPQQGPPTPGGPTAVRVDARPGVVYGYDVRDILQPDEALAAVVAADYVGQSRNQRQRDLQHRGLAPERDGVVREKPWADRIVAAHILERGVWTDAELNKREQWWIDHLKPRLNKAGNEGNPDRIPIYTQHELRKQRDPNWTVPDWSRRRPAPLPQPVADLYRSLWSWLAALGVTRWARRRWQAVRWWVAVWLLATVAAWIWLPVAATDAPLAAAAGLGVVALWWKTRTKKKTRTGNRAGRANTRRRTR